MKSNKNKWIRLRDELLGTHELDLYDVWQMEQQFIKACIKKDKSIFENGKVVKHSEDILKGMLINFISGIVF